MNQGTQGGVDKPLSGHLALMMYTKLIVVAFMVLPIFY